MKTTIELLTAVRDHHGSDRKAAPLFGVTQTTFSDWRNGAAFPTDENALRLAELLQLDPAYVLAIVRHDRAKSAGAKKVWRRIADQFKDAAIVAAMAIGAASFGGFNNNAFAAPSAPQLDEANTHCARNKRRRLLGAAQ